MAGQVAPILIGEKTAQQIRDAEALRQQAQAMYGQAEARINAIATAVREARDLPETWQVALMSDGKYYLVAPAQQTEGGAPAAAAPAAAEEMAAAEPEPAAVAEPPQRKPARRAR